MNEGLSIRYSMSAGSTPAFALLTEGWNELVQDGMTPDGLGICPIGPQTEILYASREDGELIGVLAWDTDAEGFVEVLSYVEPSSRRQGVYKALVEAWVGKARNCNVKKIRSVVHVENAVMQSVMRHFNRRPVQLVFEQDV